MQMISLPSYRPSNSQTATVQNVVASITGFTVDNTINGGTMKVRVNWSADDAKAYLGGLDDFLVQFGGLIAGDPNAVPSTAVYYPTLSQLSAGAPAVLAANPSWDFLTCIYAVAYNALLSHAKLAGGTVENL